MSLLTPQDLVSLVKLGKERQDLDYKEEIDLTSDKKHKAEIAKDVIAMANSGGGVVIGGVPETAAGYIWRGMAADALEAFDSTSLNDFLKSYCAPPINTTTQKVEVDGKVYGVIVVPEFADQPHIVIKDYPGVLNTGDILIRSASNNSVRADPEHLRKLIDLAVRRRQGVLKEFLQAALSDRRPQLVGAAPPAVDSVQAPFDRTEYAKVYKAFRVITLRPSDEQILLSPMCLRQAAEKGIVYRPNGYESFPPAVTHGDVEQRLPIGVVFKQESEPDLMLAFTFLGTDGMVFSVESLWEDRRWTVEKSGSVGILTTCARILESLLFARTYYPAINFLGSVQIRFSQESAVPRQVVLDSRDFWFPARRYANDFSVPVTVQRLVPVAMPLEQVETTCRDMIREFFWYFNLDLGDKELDNHLGYVKDKLVRIPKDLG